MKARFIGKVSTDWHYAGRAMTLTAPVAFTDARGQHWLAHVGSIINGASVPRFFIRLFPAYVGKYRRATVIHDVYCTTKERPSRDVHRMFYEAMRCDGTNIVTAWLMWLAVRVFGPRF